MSKISGIDFNNISSLNGVLWNSVANIGGISISHGASCDIVSYGYSNGETTSPYDSCFERPQNYDFDSVNNLLYISGGCGVNFANAGFYSDGRTIFYWDGFSSFSPFDNCGR
jgi:hypothetical protein